MVLTKSAWVSDLVRSAVGKIMVVRIQGKLKEGSAVAATALYGGHSLYSSS